MRSLAQHTSGDAMKATLTHETFALTATLTMEDEESEPLRVDFDPGSLELLDKAHDFDSTAIDTPLDHREATRVISASQFGSGAWLEVAPDASLPFTRPRSGPYTIALQRQRLRLVHRVGPRPQQRP